MKPAFILFTVTSTVLAAAPVMAGEPVHLKLTSGGRERTFHLHMPEKLNAARPAPLVLMFHGAGGDGLTDLGMYA